MEASLIWRRAVIAGLLVCGFAVPGTAEAQYFGRNKVQYQSFEFEVLRTEHYDLYYYPEEADAARIVGRMAERWYDRLSRFFGHELRGRQPLILYAVSAHFRQTNAIEGLIGEGTGGVTESIKRRVVLPMGGSLADTDHVLGHEMVHAFQFDLTGDDVREAAVRAPEILAYPLWFVEGMAEYLSLGPVDGQTAMWLRDAVLREALPHISDLDDPDYFPYRWGHAFWAYVGAKYGDRAVASLIRSAANPRYDLPGLALQLGTDPDTLTAEWHQAITAMTLAAVPDGTSLESDVRHLISRAAGGGRFNVGPRLSPDGRHLVFFSEKDRFSIDLYLADAETGRIIRKLSQSATDPHFDSLEFLNSAGSWSPAGDRFVIAAIKAGRPVLAMLDPFSGRVRREIALEGLHDALNPSFSPDGAAVVFSGNHGGLIDLYVVSLETEAITQLTDDPFADLEAVFTPDGRSIIFVSERFSTSLETLQSGSLQLARLDRDTLAVAPIAGFLHGKHLSPQVSPDGRTVSFIAEPNGVSNLYRMPIDGGPIEQVSSFLTGVAGITASSPALTSATATGRLAFSVFEQDGHSIYTLDAEDVVGVVPPQATAQAAVLPGRTEPEGTVQRFLDEPGRGLPDVDVTPAAEDYDGGLRLDAIGQPTVSAGVGEFGAFVGGSMSAFFSDMLGDHLLSVGVQVGGNLKDLGGQLAFVNRKHRWNWAASVEQIPYRLGFLQFGEDADADELLVTEVIERQISRGAFGVTAFPFSASTRVEFSGGMRSLTFTRDFRTRVFDASTRNFVERREHSEEIAAPLYLGETSAALVHDTSFYGGTGPIFGTRYRLEVGRSVGSLNYTSLLADWRRYLMPVRPVTIAIRGLHAGRYGQDSEHPQLIDLYAGYPELVHGYGIGSFAPDECTNLEGTGQCAVFDRLIGSRMLVTNLEVRAPLVGLFRRDIEYGPVPVEVAAFVDAAVTWTADTRPAFAGGQRRWVRSVGGAARVNAFGLFIVEISAAKPLDRRDGAWRWQVGLRQPF